MFVHRLFAFIIAQFTPQMFLVPVHVVRRVPLLCIVHGPFHIFCLCKSQNVYLPSLLPFPNRAGIVQLLLINLFCRPSETRRVPLKRINELFAPGMKP
jgi:hypothetical protein